MSRFIPAYRLPDKALVGEVMTMCGEIGVEIYKRQEELAAIRVDRRPDLPRIKCPTIVVCGRDDAATPLFLSEEMATAINGSRADRGRAVRASWSRMEKPEETNAILQEVAAGATAVFPPSPPPASGESAGGGGERRTSEHHTGVRSRPPPQPSLSPSGREARLQQAGARSDEQLADDLLLAERGDVLRRSALRCSPSTSSVCSPSAGGGRVSSTGVSEKR